MKFKKAASIAILATGLVTVRTQAPTAQPYILEQIVSRPLAFDNLSLGEQFEPQIDFWKRILTEIDGVAFYNKTNHKIVAIEDKSTPAKLERRRRQLEKELIVQGQAKSRDISYMTGRAGMLEKNLSKLDPWMEHVTRSFRANGISQVMAYQAVLESNFNPNAVSIARAVGAYQFVKDTAKHFLMINGSIDERLDPVRQARAAAMLHRANYARYGIEEIAVGAYHSGEGNYDRALAFARAVDGDAQPAHLMQRIIQDLPKQPLKVRGSYGRASSSYVQGVIGSIRGMQDRKFGEPLEFDTVKLAYKKSAIRVNDISKKMGINADELRELNPAILYLRRNEQALIRKLRTGELTSRLPEGYELRLPADQGEAFVETFANSLSDNVSVRKHRRSDPLPHAYHTSADAEYEKLIELRRRGLFELVTPSTLEEIKSLYVQDLERTTSPELKEWVESSIKVIEYDIFRTKSEYIRNHWEKISMIEKLLNKSRLSTQRLY